MMHFMQQQKLILLIVDNFPIFPFPASGNSLKSAADKCNFQDIAQFPSKAKINSFGNLFNIEGPKAPLFHRLRIFFRKSRIVHPEKGKNTHTHFSLEFFPLQNFTLPVGCGNSGYCNYYYYFLFFFPIIKNKDYSKNSQIDDMVWGKYFQLVENMYYVMFKTFFFARCRKFELKFLFSLTFVSNFEIFAKH